MEYLSGEGQQQSAAEDGRIGEEAPQVGGRAEWGPILGRERLEIGNWARLLIFAEIWKNKEASNIPNSIISFPFHFSQILLKNGIPICANSFPVFHDHYHPTEWLFCEIKR